LWGTERAGDDPCGCALDADLARAIRAHALHMNHRSGASHSGRCFTATDVLAVRHDRIMRVEPARPDSMGRGRFILSKRRGAARYRRSGLRPLVLKKQTGWLPVRIGDFALDAPMNRFSGEP
jgi:hypothetical protein